MRPLPILSLLTLVVASVLHAQSPAPPPTSIPEPATPPARAFHDPRSGIAFQVPAGWNLSRKDGEVSTLRLDARSTTRATQLRAVANIAFNPYPDSTFSGAYFYLSLTPKVSPNDCVAQATIPGRRKLAAKAMPNASSPTESKQVAGVSFSHGYDEHGGVCTESRDDIYTVSRNGSCLRFDLVVNNFCGGDVSGVRDITEKQLAAVRKRLEAILATVQLDQ